MIIQIERENETVEEFDKIVDQIIRDVVELRGMPIEKGRFAHTFVKQIERDELLTAIIVNIREVECHRLEDF